MNNDHEAPSESAREADAKRKKPDERGKKIVPMTGPGKVEMPDRPAPVPTGGASQGLA
jgi:hypothetical protein